MLRHDSYTKFSPQERKEIYDRMCQLRKDLKLTVIEVGQRMNLSKNTLSHIIRMERAGKNII